MIDTRLVYGFLDAGKTTCITDWVLNDFFYKRGTTLILCFEQGEKEYDTEALLEKKTYVAYYDGKEDIGSFCADMIAAYEPDRICVEMNAMIPGLADQFPSEMNVTYAVTWIDWPTMELYFANFRQMISQMVSGSHQVIFRGCPSKELLAPYSQAFQLMNRKASCLRQDPMGYHEKAFDIFLPYSLEAQEITITEKEYLPFWLDASGHPEHYGGKKICFRDPLELRSLNGSGAWSAGRVVMTCCMADLQFMSFEMAGADKDNYSGGWITFEAFARLSADEYGRRIIKLEPVSVNRATPPEQLILTPGAAAE